MNTRLRILLAFALAAVAVLAALAVVFPREPTYQGRRLQRFNLHLREFTHARFEQDGIAVVVSGAVFVLSAPAPEAKLWQIGETL